MGFNPRPPFPGGDARSRASLSPPFSGFNPRPPFPGGDAWIADDSQLKIAEFQSTPPVSGRRCGAEKPEMLIYALGKFQSTPPVSGRRCIVNGGGRAAGRQVSIHAPRFREAMLVMCWYSLSTSMFQSTPPVSGRRCASTTLPWPTPSCFNPRPPFPGGDAAGRKRFLYASFCFNPRPPFPGGDALLIDLFEVLTDVSIHAPRFREAMREI